MNNFAITFYLKDLINDYDKFTDLIKEYTDINLDLPENQILNKKLFKHIFNFYCNSNVNYDTPNAFYRFFFITYDCVFDKYKKRFELINKIWGMTPEQMAIINTSYFNLSMNDGSIPETPLDKNIEFVNSQNSSRIHGNLFNAFINAIEEITKLNIDKYLEEFKHHFMQIFIPQILIFEGDK